MAEPPNPIRVGTAGWSIPKDHAGAFPLEGSHLERYGAVLNAVEINTSFYRPHRRTTYEALGQAVPAQFRFAVKVPRAITHEHRLMDSLLDRFLAEVAGLGQAARSSFNCRRASPFPGRACPTRSWPGSGPGRRAGSRASRAIPPGSRRRSSACSRT